MCTNSLTRAWFLSALAGCAQKLATLSLVGLIWGFASLAQAVQYDFLSVSGNNIPGNSALSTFSSNNSLGSINVTHSSPLINAWGTQDNINSAIYPSSFPILFPGTGIVQGHLAMSMYGPAVGSFNVTQVTFDLTPYNGNLQSLVFGIWNTTDQVNNPAYSVQLLVNNNLQAPTFNYFGNEDNASQVSGAHKITLQANGDLVWTTPLGGSTHTDAIFIDNLPVGTTQIIVTGHLGPLNNIGDGVGYYFVEPVAEPSSLLLAAVGFAGLATIRNRIRRKAGN
jgi:hypothetical protein